jgi:hypothetical protein
MRGEKCSGTMLWRSNGCLTGRAQRLELPEFNRSISAATQRAAPFHCPSLQLPVRLPSCTPESYSADGVLHSK